MKTMFVLDLVRRLQVPTLYLSNDSDETTVAGRMLAANVSRSADVVTEEMRRSREWASSRLAGYDNIRWSFDPSPSLEDLDVELEAFQEVFGEYPWMVVIDILDNISYYEDSEHGSTARILQYLHATARTTGAVVLVVHHATESAECRPCPPRSAILQKQNKLPVLILTTAVQGDSFFLAPVKNRHGFQDPSGRSALSFHVDPDTCTFREW